MRRLPVTLGALLGTLLLAGPVQAGPFGFNWGRKAGGGAESNGPKAREFGGSFGQGFGGQPTFEAFILHAQRTMGNQWVNRFMHEFQNPHSVDPLVQQMREQLNRQRAERERVFQDLFWQSIFGTRESIWKRGAAQGQNGPRAQAQPGPGASQSAGSSQRERASNERASSPRPERRTDPMGWARHVLGVEENTGPADIKHAYYELAKKTHPNFPENRTPEKEDLFKDAGQAYRILTGREHR